MAKFYGKIGYAETKEEKPGVWKEVITEREYFGDIGRNTRNLQPSSQINDNVEIANEISIVADQFAYHHFHTMRYVEFMGAKWKIAKVDASQPPRLILTTGGLYNGEQT